MLERLGRGGMADVYRAYQPGMDRYVAIKVMHAHLAEDPGFVTRFKREAQAVGTLRHPNIVQVIDFDSTDNEYYMVMEFIESDSLKAMLTRRGALPVIEALAMMTKITDAVAYAHSMGMIHRDLKPANILLTKVGEPILTDFGIAKILSATNLTTTGMAIGTPTYMSPEAGRGEKVDERSDLYSLGVMFYEMVTGTLPYDADTPWAVILKHINEPLPLPSTVMPDLPSDIERILLKAMAKNPAERFQSAAEMRDALSQGQATLPTKAHTQPARPASATHFPKQTQPTPEVAGRKRGSNRLTFGVLTALLIAGSAAVFAANEQSSRLAAEGQTATAVQVGVIVAQLQTATMLAMPTITPTDAPAPTATEVPTDLPTEIPAETSVETLTETPTEDVPAEDTYPELTAEVQQAIQDGRYDDALAALEGPLAENPESYYLRVLRAVVLVQYREVADKLQEARTIAEQGIADFPDRPEAYLIMALYWGRSPFDDHAQAVQFATDAIDRGFTPAGWVHWFRGEQRRASGGATEDILADFDKAIELEPENEAYYRWRGEFHLNEWNLPAAQADFEKSIELQPAIWKHNQLAYVYIAQELKDAAFELYRRSIEEDLVTDAEYLADGAIIAWYIGNLELADKWSTDARAIDPKYAPTRYAQALVAWAKGDLETAIKYFDEIKNGEDPTDYHRSYFLRWFRLGRELDADRGYVLNDLGRKDEAIEAFKANIEQHADFIESYIPLAKLYAERGDKEAARVLYQQVLRVASERRNIPLREEVLGLLKELGD
jgi:tetratricopeptide (TPR) repeat protein